MKLIVLPAALAVALATRVLPQPGGPYNKTPRHNTQHTFNISSKHIFQA